MALTDGPAGVNAESKPWYARLYVQVLLAIALGALLGHFYPDVGAQLKPLGDGFINLVKMIIAPVIFLTVATGIAGMKDMSSVGSVAVKAFTYFLFFSTLALVVGLVVANVVQPGAGLDIDAATLDTSAVTEYAGAAEEQSISGFLLDIIPKTLFSAFTEGKILQVLLVAILAGVAMAATRPHSDLVLDIMSSFSEVVFKLVHMLMKLAPLGAFGAMAFTIGEFGIRSLANLAALVGTFYLTSLLFVLVVLGAVARLAGFSIFGLIRYLREELLLVLGTSSSEAALPSLMEKMEVAGCRPRDPHRLFVQPRRHQHLHDVGCIVHCAGIQCRPVARRTSRARAGGDDQLEGCSRRDRLRIHHPRCNAVGGSLGPGRRDGADSRDRSLHERMPRADQLHR